MRIAWYKLIASQLVTRYWPVVIIAWIALAVGLKSVAPRWNDIAADGDLAFLPDTVPSSMGLRALNDAFPGTVSRSQMVMVFANEQQELSAFDLAYALDVARRLHWLVATSARESLSENSSVATSAEGYFQGGDSSTRAQVDHLLVELARDNLTEAIEIEEELSAFIDENLPQIAFQRLPNAYQMRGEILEQLGETDQALLDFDTAKLLLEERVPVLSEDLPSWYGALHDVWSWRNAIVGHKLASEDKHARLLTIQLDTEFTATGNIAILEGIEELAQDLRRSYESSLSPGLRVEMTGSGAVGADMLRAAASGVRKTEFMTIGLVLLILALVYRAPFLVAIPLTSIALSLVVATSVIALLARDPLDPQSYGLGVFTTTRIFIVVLLFGAGTDFCLFFLARNRELLQSRRTDNRQHIYRVIASGWRSVHDALVASAFTTIVGLAMMWFSQFEKFQFSGPIIAISLAITLLVCLTFTPALLSAIGRVAFWPLLSQDATEHRSHGQRWVQRWWGFLASLVVTKPRLALGATALVLCIPSIYGVWHLGSVTYDLTEELSTNATSRRGEALVNRYFPTLNGSPVTVLLEREAAFADEESLRAASQQISNVLYIEGVESVRSLTDPLGDYPPGKRMGLFDKDAWRRRILQSHRITRERYVSSAETFSKRVAKFDVVLKANPFSIDASKALVQIRERLSEQTRDATSPWANALVTTSGTTVGITDLRVITQADQRRIQCLVALGVWLVLVVLLRGFVLPTYLVFTVLLSYFATLGVTYGWFSYLYGNNYSGLDWKVPIFLFVILVAVGQDYNVYLVTRIFEEHRKAGMIESVRSALQKTAGIITSCGVVMAGTFVAMTSPAVIRWYSLQFPDGWFASDAPVLRGITELGFALAFGVLLDTLVVRSILVPSFIVVWRGRKDKNTVGSADARLN